MTRLIIAPMLAAMMLAGCANNRPGEGELFMSREEVAAKDDAICRKYGAKPGEAAYIQCRVVQDQRRDAVENAPVYVPHATTCTTTGNVTQCF
jgi:hypothetical protein